MFKKTDFVVISIAGLTYAPVAKACPDKHVMGSPLIADEN
jgi:hypothetical protein